MSIISFGIHKKKKALTDAQYAADVKNFLAPAIRDLAQNLQHLNNDILHSLEQRSEDTRQLLVATKLKLNSIARALEAGPARLAPLDPLDRSNTNEHKYATQQAKANAEFLEEKVQDVVNVYNELIQHPAIAQKMNQSVSHVFADFFTKIADFFRNRFGSKLQGNWTHSAAQAKLSSSFNGVFMNVEQALKSAATRAIPENKMDAWDQFPEREMEGFGSANEEDFKPAGRQFNQFH